LLVSYFFIIINFFQAKLRKLPREIQEKVAQILSCFHRNRNVYYLVHSLKAILSESEQQLLFPSLRQVNFVSMYLFFLVRCCGLPYFLIHLLKLLNK